MTNEQFRNGAHQAIGALVQNLGALVPLGAALVGIVLWLNSEFRDAERRQQTMMNVFNKRQEEMQTTINTLTLCILAREQHPDFRCPLVR